MSAGFLSSCWFKTGILVPTDTERTGGSYLDALKRCRLLPWACCQPPCPVCAGCSVRSEPLGCKLLQESVSCVRRGQQTEARRKGKNSKPGSSFLTPAHSSLPPQAMSLYPGLSPPQPFPHINPHPYLHMYGRGLLSPQHTSLLTSPVVFTVVPHHYL